MRIERSHNLGESEAIRRIDTFMDELMRRPLPAGLTIEAPCRSWAANVLSFSFKAKKGWLGTTIAGCLHVNEQSVVLESELPGILTTLVSEEHVRSLINQQFDSLLCT